MKKTLIVLLSLCCLAFGYDKQRIAVYMQGEEPPNAKGSYKILGSKLAEAITKSDNYTAVDRTTEILDQLNKEQNYARSGAVDNDQIKKLGKQFGVQYLCIAEISEAIGSNFLEARLINVETAETKVVASESSNLKDINDAIEVAQKIAVKLLGGESGTEKITLPQVHQIPPSSQSAPKPVKAEQSLLKKPHFWAGIALEAIGAGLLIYGLSEENNVKDIMDSGAYKNKSEYEKAKKSADNRNFGYITGSALLLCGISIHVFF